MKTLWILESPNADVPPHAEFKSLEEVREFLRAQGISIRDDKGWRVREMRGDGAELAQSPAAFLVSDQGAHAKSILALIANSR